MISPKTESGYKIGRLSAHKELSKTVSMQYVVTIVQSDGSGDKKNCTKRVASTYQGNLAVTVPFPSEISIS